LSKLAKGVVPQAMLACDEGTTKACEKYGTHKCAFLYQGEELTEVVNRSIKTEVRASAKLQGVHSYFELLEREPL